MKNRISNKLYGALLRCGTPPDIAATLAKNAEFLGESSEESMERDNYEIMVTAKALSSLIKRHINEETNTAATNQIPRIKSNPAINTVSEACPTDTQIIERTEDVETNPKEAKRSIFWTKLESLPDWLRNLLSVLIPTLMYVIMVLLTAVVIGLIGACIIGIIGLTIAGIILFIVGLLYGVSQITVFPAAAYYEIGLGLILGGSSALLIVLLYNALTKLLPSGLRLGIKKLRKLTKSFSQFRAEIREKAENA